MARDLNSVLAPRSAIHSLRDAGMIIRHSCGRRLK